MTDPVRAATAADLAAVMAIERASFPSDAWSEQAMRETIAGGDSFVAERDDAVVGYAAVLAHPGGEDADVLTIAVALHARGGGLGAALLQRLVDTAASRGARRVFLEVRADNPVARRLYATRGFHEIAVRPRYYQPDDVDAVVMRRDLEEAR